jgi:hypothetical protein
VANRKFNGAGTNCVKGDRMVLYNFGEQIVSFLYGNVVFSVTVRGKVSLMWTGTECVKGDKILLYNCGE